MKHILVATDFSDASGAALRAAHRLATAHDARVTIAHVYDPLPLSPAVSYPAVVWSGADFAGEMGRTTDKLLFETKTGAFDDLADVETVGIRHTSASTALCDAAEDRGADLIVVGTHSRKGASRLLLGSVAEQTMRHAKCPVLVARPAAHVSTFPEHIAVTTDFSTAAEPGIAQAGALARKMGSKVTLMHAYEKVSAPVEGSFMAFQDIAPQLRKALEEKARETLGADAAVDLATGHKAGPVLLERIEALGADLVVIATHGRTGLTHLLLGSVAQKIARLAPCSVWVAR